MEKKLKITLFIVFALLIAVSGSVAFFNVVYSNKIFPNIAINGESYSGLTQKEASGKLQNIINTVYKNGLVLTYKDKTYKADISKIGAKIDIEKTTNSAFIYGHGNNFLQNLAEQAALTGGKKDFEIKAGLGDLRLEKYIAEEMSKIETPPKNFGYKYDDGIFNPQIAKSGMIIDRDSLKNSILNNLSGLKNETVKINLVKKDPEVASDRNNSAVAQAYNLLNKKIAVKYNSSSWEIAKEDLALWIKFGVANDSSYTDKKILAIRADKEKIKDYLTTLVPQINLEPVNATLEFKDGKVKIFSLDHEGLALNMEKSADEIEKNVFTAENYKDNSAKNIEAQIAIDKVKPEITMENIDNMGLTSLLAAGESNFAGSPNNRKHNIAVGAEKFNGILVGPGDEFSFVKVLGEVGSKEGYLPELVIKKGQTIPEYGGGLCQVSTTAFRAAVLAGLEITERKNHAYPVKYYNPQGSDATIYPPNPDLKFKNNTPAYILIQTRIAGNKLYFDFYGSSDGRKVVADSPKVYDKKPDGSMKADWTQEVYDKSGVLMFKKTFHSVYKSPALYPHKNPLE